MKFDISLSGVFKENSKLELLAFITNLRFVVL